MFFTILLISSALSASVLGQITQLKPTTSTRTNIAGTSDGRQWEYLIVSFGKVYFSDPISDTDVKTSGLSKLISFSKAGIVIANEAVTTESKLDTLGKFGWELVGIVGAIGGDQELLFKRMYIPERSKQEEQLIKEEGERMKLALDEEKKRTASLANAPTTVLVDLDELDRISSRDTYRRNEENRLKTAVESYKNYPITITSLFSNAESDGDSDVHVKVNIDATSTLLSDSNKYRSKDAARLANAVAVEMFKAAHLKQHYSDYASLAYRGGAVNISVSVIINFGGQPKVVGEKTVSGDWPDRTSPIVQ